MEAESNSVVLPRFKKVVGSETYFAEFVKGKIVHVQKSEFVGKIEVVSILSWDETYTHSETEKCTEDEWYQAYVETKRQIEKAWEE